MRYALPLIVCTLFLYLTACGSEESASYSMADMAIETVAESSYDYTEAEAYAVVPSSRHETSAADRGPIAELPTAAQQRKIIFTADIQLVVDEFEGVNKAVTDLAKKHGGFIASSNIYGSEGEPRRGDWTLRIPSQHFDIFVDGSKALGQVRCHSQDSQEVTAEYVDLEARSRNLKAEEQRLHKHLDESTRSLKDILEVEREIARVRGEIERIQGRLNVLKDLTSLSTVSLSIEEIKDYIPEPTEEPSYATQLARTWDNSTGAVGGFFTNLSLGIVGFVPWLVVLLPLTLMGWLGWKRLRRHLPYRRPIAVGTEKQPMV